MRILEMCKKTLILSIYFPNNEKIMAKFPLVFAHADTIIFIFVYSFVYVFRGEFYILINL